MLKSLFWLLTLLTLTPNAYAKDTWFRRDIIEGTQNPDVFASSINASIDGLVAGDVVYIQNSDNSNYRVFKLGKRLGAGEMGVVFYLADSNPPKVIKLQKGGAKARLFMMKEIEAMQALKRKGIPSPEMSDWHGYIYIVKDFIQGKNLMEECGGWANLSPSQQKIRLDSLAKLLSELRATNRCFTDLHWGNIMFNEKTNGWEVIDPGFYIYDKPKLDVIYSSLQKYYPSIYQGLLTAEQQLAAMQQCRNLQLLQ